MACSSRPASSRPVLPAILAGSLVLGLVFARPAGAADAATADPHEGMAVEAVTPSAAGRSRLEPPRRAARDAIASVPREAIAPGAAAPSASGASQAASGAAATVAAAPPGGGASIADPAARPNALRDDAIVAALWGLVEQAQRIVRAYAQLGLEVRVPNAHAAIADALRAGDRHVAALASSGQRRVVPARARELSTRWRALRDAAATRPEPAIGRLMDDVARQIAAIAVEIAPSGPASRDLRQRVLLHRMAGLHLLACWGATPPERPALLSLRAEFGHLLAQGADPVAGDLDAATISSQWGLLAGALDAHGARCDPAASDRTASTADRLAQLLDPASPKLSSARRP